MNIDFMSATITVKPLISNKGTLVPLLVGVPGINNVKYDDPVDFLLLENGQILRTESNAYFEQE